MSFGGGGSQSTTTSNVPPKWQRPYLRRINSRAENMSKNFLKFPDFQTYAGFNDIQKRGMNNMLQTGREMGWRGLRFEKQLNEMMNAPMNIVDDPATKRAMRANRQSVMGALQEDMLPGINRGAVAAGQMGGSRQGIMEGQAMGDAAKAISAGNADILGQARSDATKLAGMAGGLMPSAMNMRMLPAQMQMDVGGMKQGMRQKGIDQRLQKHSWAKNQRWDDIMKQSSILHGMPGFGTSTTTGPGQSPIAGALGGAMTGLGAMNTFAGMTGGMVPGLAGLGGGMAAAALPWVGIPALLGAGIFG